MYIYIYNLFLHIFTMISSQNLPNIVEVVSGSSLCLCVATKIPQQQLRFSIQSRSLDKKKSGMLANGRNISSLYAWIGKRWKNLFPKGHIPRFCIDKHKARCSRLKAFRKSRLNGTFDWRTLGSFASTCVCRCTF